MSLESVQHLLRKYHIQSSHDLGQNFLINDDVLKQIVSTAKSIAADTILEIGSGIGNLTVLLADQFKRVVAVEIDPRFQPLLTKLAEVHSNLHLVQGDILRIHFSELADALELKKSARYSIVANIPYYLTAHLVRHVLSFPQLPESIFFLMQKEVAERIVAKPGDHSKLSLAVQLYAQPQIMFAVPKADFYPEPQVDSVLICFSQVHAWDHPSSEKQTWQLINFGFSAKRKKLINNLIAGYRIPRETILEVFKKVSISPDIRAQDLSTDEWIKLALGLGAAT